MNNVSISNERNDEYDFPGRVPLDDEVTVDAGAIQTMSSREIVDLCEKRHDHVLRDVRSILEEAGIGALKFEGTYLDAVAGEPGLGRYYFVRQSLWGTTLHSR